jgi:hypothetical protein
MDKNQKLHTSSQVYDAIAQDSSGSYPFATGVYHAPFIKPIIRQLWKANHQPIHLTEIGPNTTPIVQFLDGLQSHVDYVGLEASSVAVAYAEQQFAHMPNIKILNIPIASDDAHQEAIATQAIQNAQVVYASYVGPSIGLLNVITYITERLQQGGQLLVIDRVYQSGQEFHLAMLGYVHFILHLIVQCLIHRVRFPLGNLLWQMTQPTIYSDSHYRSAEKLWRSNATGNRKQVREQILTVGRTHGIHFNITFTGDVIILVGKK